MTDKEKKRKLFQFKVLATGLFLLMAAVFISTTVIQKHNDSHWIGYVRAFSEAAMVGALADWFAVTALFHYPLGLRIPHTNLIANSKQRIGDNLGSFVVDNFLSAQNIRPYIEKVKVSGFVSEWLMKESNQKVLIGEVSSLIKSALTQFENEAEVKFISGKIKEMSAEINMSKIISSGLFYLLEKNEQEKIITFTAKKIKTYVLHHEEIIQEKVSENSYSLVPKFIDKKIANKIISALYDYFSEIENDVQHPLRQEITNAAWSFCEELKTTPKYEPQLQKIKDSFLQEKRIDEYSHDIWNSIKQTLERELDAENSTLKKYVKKNISQYAQDLNADEELQSKIDRWIRYNAYRMILKNSGKAAELISSTVGNWEEKELSRKLELEVGKDLQFIRVNGTLVGGLVGLIIYTIAHFLV